MHPLAMLGIVLLVLWAALWLGFHVVGGIVHVLLLVGALLLVWGLVKRGARAVDRHV